MARRFLLSWFADATAQHFWGAVLGSALVTSLISATTRSLVTLSWEWSWVLWTGTALASYVGLLRTAPHWLPKVAAQRARKREDDDVPRPTLEMLEAGRRERQAKREALIKSWRGMVYRIHRDMTRPGAESKPTVAWLKEHPEFLSLKPHLDDQVISTLYGRVWVSSLPNSSLEGSLHRVLQDIDRIEEEWGLV
jgi:hypothetical protein